ncbi:hypothetical protein [Streptomyces sp. NPDC059258]|uniref:hypothetical protein n=1 Tax=unclassified Streptomyces TaxID=2593676 RepID=UPI00369D2DC2
MLKRLASAALTIGIAATGLGLLSAGPAAAADCNYTNQAGQCVSHWVPTRTSCEAILRTYPTSNARFKACLYWKASKG